MPAGLRSLLCLRLSKKFNARWPMSEKRIRNVSPRQGYDVWSEQYDAMLNPVVTLEGMVSQKLLQPRRGERILDAGRGTGRNLIPLSDAGAIPFGLNFSIGHASSGEV